ncbi:hypothetical protein DFP72DRAFT_829228 [Ephemerocybe angulata]|uniref:Uncharacterized protein n=1 Tax=Ephemerocybe angulata TaxID=980116 RepID=A0A8H6H9M1_9AGAR|nr:hypothetical protein DFP72DRAFT_829228 [Tulosesus angulatus]
MEGATDDHPIELVGYKKCDFATLLRALYPSYEDVISGGFAFSEEEWISVLKLSTIWGIQKLRDQSIDKLSGISPLQKVTLGRAYQVRKWLLDGISECVRGRSKTADALLTPGLETAFKILWIRDQCATLHGLSFNTKGLQVRLSLLRCADCTERYYEKDSGWFCGSCARAIGVDDVDAITLSRGQCEWVDGKERIRIDPPNMECTTCALPVIPPARRVKCPRCDSNRKPMEFILEGRADVATLVLEEFGGEIIETTPDRLDS